MRPVERIDNFLNKVDWFKLWKKWDISITNKDINNILVPYWKENHDQRIGQAAINLGLVPDNLIIWSDEEWEILQDQGLEPEEYLFWTSYLDKDENKLDKPITRLIKDLDVAHIRAIKAYFNKHQAYLPPNYVKAFNNVLTKKGQ